MIKNINDKIYYNLPTDIIDYILSYSDGYIRTELKKNNICVKLKNNILDIGNILFLEYCYTSFKNDGTSILFVNKKNTNNSFGYESKTVNTYGVYYCWIKIIRH